MLRIQIALGLLLVACAVLKYKTWEFKGSLQDQSAKLLFNKYVIAFILFKFADWCQGPYFYEVYKSKEIAMDPDSHFIVAVLFLSGFISSMLFGTIVGGFVDKIGRKRGCLLFCILYILAAVSTHFQSPILLFGGRICGGIATSLLFSAPESWLMTEKTNGKHSEETLSFILGWAYFLDGIVAILAGLVAHVAKLFFDLTGPFDVSAAILVVAFVYVFSQWTENFGNQRSGGFENFRDGCKVIKQKNVLALGAIQSLFEGSMYVFVLLWVPVLSDSYLYLSDFDDLPTGLVFAVFMTGCMIGSTLFSIYIKMIPNVFEFSRYIFFIASIVIGVCIFTFLQFDLPFISFIVFEICVGCYYPCIGMMRSILIPDDLRSTIMNMYRIPLNLFVAVVFLLIDYLSPNGAFFVSSLSLAIAAYLQHYLYTQNIPRNKTTERIAVVEGEEESPIFF